MKNVIQAIFGRKKNSTPARDISPLIDGIGRDALLAARGSDQSRSYFGGDPLLPTDMQWPQKNDKRLGFLARISLPDLQARCSTSWLPKEGALLFFYDDEEQPWGFDPKDRGGWAVLLVPDIIPITPRPFLKEEDLLPHKLIDLTPISVLPSYERPEVQSLNLSDEEFERYHEEVERRFCNSPRHQLLGVPSPVQGDHMELECQLASNGVYCGNADGYATPMAKSLEAGAANWRLLFQIDSDDDLSVMWGDVGTIYFWVEESAAREGRFDNVWLVLQCS
ncbi:MAG: YwqG family protein [Steroidobacteraceae bacterium]